MKLKYPTCLGTAILKARSALELNLGSGNGKGQRMRRPKGPGGSVPFVIDLQGMVALSHLKTI